MEHVVHVAVNFVDDFLHYIATERLSHAFNINYSRLQSLMSKGSILLKAQKHAMHALRRDDVYIVYIYIYIYVYTCVYILYMFSERIEKKIE